MKVDILKAATDWAKAEVFSSAFFILFGVLFIVASIGFWQLGKTDLAKAYIVPTLVAGLLTLTIGLGLVLTNKSRVTSFAVDHSQDAAAFVESEIARVDKTLDEYKVIVFKIVPLIIVVAALLVVFTSTPGLRAICVTTLAMMVVILMVDGTAHARIDAYGKQLVSVSQIRL